MNPIEYKPEDMCYFGELIVNKMRETTGCAEISLAMVATALGVSKQSAWRYVTKDVPFSAVVPIIQELGIDKLEAWDAVIKDYGNFVRSRMMVDLKEEFPLHTYSRVEGGREAPEAGSIRKNMIATGSGPMNIREKPKKEKKREQLEF